MMIAGLMMLAPVSAAAPGGKGDWCYAPTRMLTGREKQAYIGEVGSAAVAAAVRWHVPAPVLIAMAIQESGFGTTRLALGSNNIFAYKWPGRGLAQGRPAFTLDCQPDWDAGNRYVAFSSRADAVEFVASRLNRGAHYAAATRTYWSAVSAGQDRQEAARRWLQAIARSYNYRPAAYVNAITKIINDPLGDGSSTLWAFGNDAAPSR